MVAILSKVIFVLSGEFLLADCPFQKFEILVSDFGTIVSIDFFQLYHILLNFQTQNRKVKRFHLFLLLLFELVQLSFVLVAHRSLLLQTLEHFEANELFLSLQMPFYLVLLSHTLLPGKQQTIVSKSKHYFIQNIDYFFVFAVSLQSEKDLRDNVAFVKYLS